MASDTFWMRTAEASDGAVMVSLLISLTVLPCTDRDT